MPHPAQGLVALPFLQIHLPAGRPAFWTYLRNFADFVGDKCRRHKSESVSSELNCSLCYSLLKCFYNTAENGTEYISEYPLVSVNENPVDVTA